MGQLIDLTGMKFGRLTVISRADRKGYSAYWLCRCECRNTTIVRSCKLRSGWTQSCGCLQRESVTTHGHKGERIYRIWRCMLNRCYYHDSTYEQYGARGIRVCDEWRGDDGFIKFYNWSMENGYNDELSIDRIDVNGHYEPSNCRWATPKEQANNRRNNIHLTIDGEIKTITQWAEVSGVNPGTIRSRHRKGWSGHDLIKPSGTSYRKKEA